jgi:hypothetical protein
MVSTRAAALTGLPVARLKLLKLCGLCLQGRTDSGRSLSAFATLAEGQPARVGAKSKSSITRGRGEIRGPFCFLSMRINVDIPDALYRALKSKAARERVSVDVLILRAVIRELRGRPCERISTRDASDRSIKAPRNPSNR